MTTTQNSSEELVVLQVRIFEDIKNKANSILAKDGMQVQDLLRFVVFQMLKNGKSPMTLDFFNADSKQDQFDNISSDAPQNTPAEHGERTPIQVRFTREQKERANKILEEDELDDPGGYDICYLSNYCKWPFAVPNDILILEDTNV